MRKIVAGLFISLDGVVESPEEWAFQYSNDEMSKGMVAGVARADAVLLGRRTYQKFAKLWPSRASDVPMADFLNNSPKYVVSATLDTLEWANSRRITGDLADALSLNVCPIVVGSGMRLFDEMTHQVRLKLVDSTTFSTGVLGVTYQPASA